MQAVVTSERVNIVISNTDRGADVSDIVDVKLTLYQPISSPVLI